MPRTCAETIILLDQTAKANAIKGVAGIKAYFFWINAISQGTSAVESLYHKVISKMTTDPDEIAIWEQTLTKTGVKMALESIKCHHCQSNGEELEIRADGSDKMFHMLPLDAPAVTLKKTADSEGHTNNQSESTLETHSSDTGDDGTPILYFSPVSGEKQWNAISCISGAATVLWNTAE